MESLFRRVKSLRDTGWEVVLSDIFSLYIYFSSSIYILTLDVEFFVTPSLRTNESSHFALVLFSILTLYACSKMVKPILKMLRCSHRKIFKVCLVIFQYNTSKG